MGRKDCRGLRLAATAQATLLASSSPLFIDGSSGSGYFPSMENIEMFYRPVPDLAKALDYYCNVLGWDEHWREGDTTAAVSPADGKVTLMLDVSTSDSDAPGPILSVDDVRSWVRRSEGEADSPGGASADPRRLVGKLG